MSQQINLYEARLRPSHALATARNLGLCTLAVLVLMTALALWTRSDAERKSEAAAVASKLQGDEQESMLALTKRMAERKVSAALAGEMEVTKAMLAARQEVIDVLDSGQLGNTSGFSGLMTGFARQSQADLWLTGFEVTRGGEEIEIRGRLLDPARLPSYVQRLSSEPVFQGRRFAALEMRDVAPEALAAEPPGVATASNGGVQPQPRLPRFVEFTLRSENAGGADGATRGGVAR